jgi:glycosyltransferase involved in cell wall biosynthesis
METKQIPSDIFRGIENLQPLITVIVAVRNVKDSLQRCIDSVAGQSYANKELIIIDGASVDGTVDILRANQSAFSYWITEADRGIYHAWNKGLSHARGDWICFIGGDDYFIDDHVLERLVPYLQSVPLNIQVAYGQLMMVNRHGDPLYILGEPWEQAGPNFRNFMSIPHVGAMHRRTLFSKRGVFDESFQISGDYELLLRELKSGEAYFAPMVLVAMQHGGISDSPANAFLKLREFRRAHRLHGQSFPRKSWLIEVIRVCARLLLWRLIGDRMARRLLDVRRRMIGEVPYWVKSRS